MQFAEKVIGDIYSQIIDVEARKIAARERMDLLRPQGVELFERSANLLKKSGFLDDVIYISGGSYRGNRRFTIVKTETVEMPITINDQIYKIGMNLEIQPQRQFDDELKPALSFLLTNNVDELHTQSIYTISQEGDMLNWKNEFCDTDDIPKISCLIYFLENNLTFTNQIPIDHPLLI
jgi:hypothetical protein